MVETSPDEAAQMVRTQTVTLQPSNTTLPPTATPEPSSTPIPTNITEPTSTPTFTLMPPTPIQLPPTAPAEGQPATYTVCAGGCNFATIQEAIDNAGTDEEAIIEIIDPVHTEAGILINGEKFRITTGRAVRLHHFHRVAPNNAQSPGPVPPARAGILPQ